jgi:hypothetical protein
MDERKCKLVESFAWNCCVCLRDNANQEQECSNCKHKRCDGIAKQFRTFPTSRGNGIYISIFTGAGATVVQTLDKLAGPQVTSGFREGSTVIRRCDEVWDFYCEDGDTGFEKACTFLLLRGWVGIHESSEKLPSF